MLNNLEYSGKWFIVIDNEDKTSDQYFEKYGTDKVIMFDKDQAYKKFDRAENFTDRKVIFAARNICFDLAKELNYKYIHLYDRR